MAIDWSEWLSIKPPFLSRKRAITTFLSRKFIITRSSIAFEDFLGSSIAPQVMPPWTPLSRCDNCSADHLFMCKYKDVDVCMNTNFECGGWKICEDGLDGVKDCWRRRSYVSIKYSKKWKLILWFNVCLCWVWVNFEARQLKVWVE